MLCYPQRLHGEAQVSRLEEQLRSKCDAFAALRKENMDNEQKVEDYRIKNSERYNVKAKTMNEHTTSPICTTIYSSWPLMYVYHYFSM